MPEKLITYTQKFTVYRTDGDHLGHVWIAALLEVNIQGGIATI